MVSIKDVAAKAGVAISTVSKVLNHYPNVSAASKEKVQAAIKELNYIPNSMAAALSSKRSARIAILINSASSYQTGDEANMQYLSGALNCARELSLDTITFFFSMLEERNAEEMSRYLKSQGVGVLLVFGLSREDRAIRALIDRNDFPAVLVDVPLSGERISSVGIDEEVAQYDVARKTIQEHIGKNSGDPSSLRVLYIAGNGNGYTTAERTKGIRRLSDELGFSLSVRYGDFSEKKARGIALAASAERDVIICASDLMAIGVLNALKELKLSRTVCGFGGLRLMAYAGNGINTVKEDFELIARKATEEARYMLNGEPGKRVYVPHSVTKYQYLDMIN